MAKHKTNYRKMGNIQWSDDGKSCKIRVSRGYRSDGKRRVLTKTLHNVTRDEAEAEVVRMAKQLGASDFTGDSMTLSTYYWSFFRDAPSNRGKPRAPTTLKGYDYVMKTYVLPKIGSLRLDRITHDKAAAIIRESASPRQCKAVLRTVLRAAYDDGYLTEKPLERRVNVVQKHKEPIQPWDAHEIIQAMDALDDAPIEVQAYFCLGLSTLSKSEAMGARPCDLSVTRLYDFMTGKETETMTVTVRCTFNEVNGFRDETKNDHRARSVPVFSPCRQRLMEIAKQCDPQERMVNVTEWKLNKRWKDWIARNGLRPVPPGTLRHTSDTLALDAGVAPDLVDKMHGRSEHTSTYRNYYRPALSAMEQASKRIGESLH